MNPGKDTASTVPDHGPKDLRIGTVRAVVRQLGLSWDDFLRR